MTKAKTKMKTDLEPIPEHDVEFKLDRKGKLVDLTIDRAFWGTGALCRVEYDEISGDAGDMCCLGFASRACGVKTSSLYRIESFGYDDINLPSNLRSARRAIAKIFPAMLQEPSDIESELSTFPYVAAEINDSTSLTDHQKEQRLRRLFAKEGVKLHFKGKRRRGV